MLVSECTFVYTGCVYSRQRESLNYSTIFVAMDGTGNSLNNNRKQSNIAKTNQIQVAGYKTTLTGMVFNFIFFQ